MEQKLDYSKYSTKEFKKSYVAGLDLGQSQDPTALIMMERTHIVYYERDPYTYNPITRTECRVVHAERLPLGTPYTDAVDRVCTVV